MTTKTTVFNTQLEAESDANKITSPDSATKNFTDSVAPYLTEQTSSDLYQWEIDANGWQFVEGQTEHLITYDSKGKIVQEVVKNIPPYWRFVG